MLGALFTTLQNSIGAHFLSKPFFIGSVFPITLFLAASTATALAVGGTPADLAKSLNPAGKEGAVVAWISTALVFATIGLAFVWSGLGPFLFELLEGKHLGWLGRWLQFCETQRLAALERRIEEYRRYQRALETARAPARPMYARMASSMLAARQRGERRDASPGKGSTNRYPTDRKGRIAATLTGRYGFRGLFLALWKHRLGGINTPKEIESVVASTAMALDAGPVQAINSRQVDVVVLIDETRERLRFERKRLEILRLFMFPAIPNISRGEAALRVLGRTRLGNVTQTTRSYALSRYGLDLDIFWTRLQKVLQMEDKQFSTVQDAKTQVDFLASLVWLTLLFTIAWGAICVWVQPAPRAFVLIGAGGPLLARLFYLAAVQNHMLFADLIRSEVDLYRLHLLQVLHLPRPPGNREENDLWADAGNWIGYGNDRDITYVTKL